MMLLSLDHAVWQDVLLNWVGSLREIVRLDFAVDVAKIKNQFRDVLAQLAFPLPVTARVTQDLLVGLIYWMQLRYVYLNRLEVKEYFVEWDDVFAWCRNSLKQLHISGTESGIYCEDTSHFLNIASVYCQRLQRFTLSNGRDQSGETISNIIRNNASTLVVISVEDGYDCSAVNLDDISCPCLQMLLWNNEECASLSAFLRRCPKLSAIFLYCSSYDAPESLESLISVLSNNCPTLRRLRLHGMKELDRAALLRIARGCRQLEFIQMSHYSAPVSENIVEILQALPHLHTIDTDDYADEAGWLEIAVRGLPPSLRVLDVYTEFSCTGFRQFTAAYPHLTGLRLWITDINIEEDNKCLFEHCGEMKHLILNMHVVSSKVVEAVLESVALSCPGLEILELNVDTQCNPWALQLVLDKCTHLKHLSTRYRYAELSVPPGVIVANITIPLTQWMPEELLPAFV